MKFLLVLIHTLGKYRLCIFYHKYHNNLGRLNLNTKESNIYRHSKEDSNIDIGFFYKYNWNVERMFFGVEFFYDFLNLKNLIDSASINIRYRYGTNLNFGYDITENFSLYGIVGYGLIKYRAVNGGIEYLDKDDNLKFRALYGFGVSYNMSVSWKINLEYNRQTLNIKLFDNTRSYNLKNDITSVKFSLIYKF